MGKILTVAVIGCGGRGADTYARIMNTMPDKYKLVSLCDINHERIRMTAETFQIDLNNCFYDENDFFQAKRADVLVIGTQDADHVRHATRGLELGYDLLLEKPITDKKEECTKLLETQKKYGGKVLVCHVLRYAPAFKKAAELLDSGKIGKLVCIDAIEQVLYWHQAHSYVRGNWRRKEDTSPMIIAKCCHDLDLLQFYAKSKCKSLSSIGDLTFFKPENAPEGSTERCLDCPFIETCPYSAKRLYIDRFKQKYTWPSSAVSIKRPLTEEVILDALRTGPYGRCVFHCDNDVVDHQQTIMQFENGVTATLTMTGFTSHGGRIMTFHGTLGEVILNEDTGILSLRRYNEEPEEWQISTLTNAGNGHGGGDDGIVEELYNVITGKSEGRTGLEESIESHLMGIAAEESRLKGGEKVTIHR